MNTRKRKSNFEPEKEVTDPEKFLADNEKYVIQNSVNHNSANTYKSIENQLEEFLEKHSIVMDRNNFEGCLFSFISYRKKYHGLCNNTLTQTVSNLKVILETRFEKTIPPNKIKRIISFINATEGSPNNAHTIQNSSF